MMEYYLGKDLFLGGLNRYLESHKFGNANESDLWASVQEVTETDDVT